MTALVWFKRDLRLADHAPLHAAAAWCRAQGSKILLAYFIEPDLWAQPDASFRHWRFIADSLSDLRESLHGIGGRILIRKGDCLQQLNDLHDRHALRAIFAHEETGNGWSYARDKAVITWCKNRGIAFHESQSHGVIRRLPTRDIWAARRDAYMAQGILPPPATLPASVDMDDWGEIPANLEPYLQADPWARDIGIAARVQNGGRKEGEKVLAGFLDSRSRHYMHTISKPGISARHCSRLSAHIAYGTLSVREVAQATEKKRQELHGSGQQNWCRQLDAFAARLAWRCHFVQKLEQQPDIEFKCMHPAFEGLRPHARDTEARLKAWYTGQTGYPLVDAVMRSLHENGWVTFRMRAMAVSFASYHLWLDWRLTAPYLARLFTDYEPGIHYAQLQMQSGVTGINAVRVYNPVKQSLEHDPAGDFIKRFVPELSGMSAQWVHMPWKLSGSTAHAATAYPPPLVDNETAMRAAKQNIHDIRKSDAFFDAARHIADKLGSRKKTSQTRKPRTSAKAAGQLSLGFDDE